MRLVQVSVPTGTREQVLDILEREGIDYVAAEARHDPDYEAHSVILSAETVLSSEFERLQEEYDAGTDGSEQIANEELRTQGREFIPGRTTYVLLSVMSAVIATAGLLLDSAAIVVGSMVIAPLVGPAMGTSVGTVLFEQDLFYEGVKHQLGGLGLTVGSAAVFALLAKTLFLVPPNVNITAIEQIAGRLTPDLLSLVVAVGAGIAGARSLSSGISTGLVGVMIAAALVPPIAAVGIGLAWWLPDVIFKAGLLVVVNTVSINLAALGTLWFTGSRPIGWQDESKARATTRHHMAAMAVVVVVLASVLGVFTYSTYQTAASTQDIRSDIEAVANDEPYRDLTVLDVSVEYHEEMLTADPTRVTVTILRPSDQQYPRLANQIDRRVEHRLHQHVETQVRFVDAQTDDRG